MAARKTEKKAGKKGALEDKEEEEDEEGGALAACLGGGTAPMKLSEERNIKIYCELELDALMEDIDVGFVRKNFEALVDVSSKTHFLLTLLENLHAEGHKLLLFSMSKMMLSFLEELLRAKTDYKFVRLDGETPMEERDELCARFNTDPKLFLCLLTTRVAGCGLNLAGADRVLIFDPDWNPATDNQAVDRAYRIGQTRDVVVYRLITSGGIEEKIYRRQIYKQGINVATLENQQKRHHLYFKNEDVMELLNYEPAPAVAGSTGCRTLDMLLETDGLE